MFQIKKEGPYDEVLGVTSLLVPFVPYLINHGVSTNDMMEECFHQTAHHDRDYDTELPIQKRSFVRNTLYWNQLKVAHSLKESDH